MSPERRPLSAEVLERIASDFPPELRAEVSAEVLAFDLENPQLRTHGDDVDSQVDIIRLGILRLSQGRLDHVRHYVRIADEDWRDILSWAPPYG